MNLKNSGDSTGFEPMTSAMPVQCTNQLNYEVIQWRQVNLLGSCFPVKGMSYERMLYAVRCLKSNEDMILALAGQFKQLSHEPEKFLLWVKNYNSKKHVKIYSTSHLNLLCSKNRSKKHQIFEK